MASGLLGEVDFAAAAGLPVEPMLEEALRIDEREPPPRAAESAEAMVAQLAIHADRYDDARRLLLQLRVRADERGDDVSLPQLLIDLAWVEGRVGNLRGAMAHIDECLGAATHQRQHWQQSAQVMRAMLRGLMGETREALSELHRLRATADDPLVPWPLVSWWAARGEVLHAAGQVDDAHAALHQHIVLFERRGWKEPGIFHADALFMDCAIGSGHLNEAAERLEVVAERSRIIGRASVLASCQRIGVLLAATRGDVEGAGRRHPRDAGSHEPNSPSSGRSRLSDRRTGLPAR